MTIFRIVNRTGHSHILFTSYRDVVIFVLTVGKSILLAMLEDGVDSSGEQPDEKGSAHPPGGAAVGLVTPK